MSISVRCPGCEHSVTVREEHVGKKVKCRRCESTFRVLDAADGAGERTKKCRHCAEQVKVEAVRCKHCGRLLGKPASPLIAVIISILIVFGAGAYYFKCRADEAAKDIDKAADAFNTFQKYK